MSASASRKNGKQASCEPCRLGKVRCDHRMPVCDRCRRRNMSSDCWYHPAPLTRPLKRTRIASSDDTGIDLTEANLQTPSVTPTPLHDNPRLHAGIRNNEHSDQALSVPDSSITSPATLPFFSLQSLDNASTQNVISTGMYDDRGNDTFDQDLASIIFILEQLHYCGTIRKLLPEYYGLGQIAAVPSHLVLPVISDLERIYEDILHQRATTDAAASKVAVSAMAHRILLATVSKTTITSSTTVAEFLSFYSGPNLRLESIGLIFSIAARASRLALVPEGEDNHEFLQTMFQCNLRCLQLARELANNMNDIIMWLSYENLRVATSIQGYSSPAVWRRLGDLSADIFGLEIHREATVAKVPFFLAECRRRIFAAAFTWDKLLATLFDRPPRIPSYYADCRLPLELTDDQLCVNGLSDQEQASLERNGGWYTGNSNISTSWIRALYLLAQFKEETLMHQLKPLDHETRSKLEDIARRCKETWEQFPDRIRYDPECWKTDKPPMVSLRLAEVYLTYLQTLYHVYRLMGKNDSHCSPEMVETCSSIIETTIQSGGLRNRASYHLHHNFRASTVLCYGLPSAITLINALKTASRSMSRVDFVDLARRVSIRRLSVFVTFLEGVYRPENANYALCIRASGLISGALDEILEYLLSLASNDTPQPGPGVIDNALAAQKDTLSHDGVAAVEIADNTLLDMFDWDAANLMDMNNWMGEIDWTNVSGGV